MTTPNSTTEAGVTDAEVQAAWKILCEIIHIDYRNKYVLALLRRALEAFAQSRASAQGGDAIKRSKRILALVDDYHDRPTNDTRSALRHALMDEFATNAPKAGSLVGDAERLRTIGTKMSNVCFNLAQQEGQVLGADACAGMKALCEQWDAAIRAGRKG